MLALVSPDGGRKKNDEGETGKRRSNPTMERMRELLKTDEAKALYKERKTIVEPVFGQIKQGRGIREFRLRGFEKTKAEWKRICLTHNLLKLYRHDWLPKRASQAAWRLAKARKRIEMARKSAPGAERRGPNVVQPNMHAASGKTPHTISTLGTAKVATPESLSISFRQARRPVLERTAAPKRHVSKLSRCWLRRNRG